MDTQEDAIDNAIGGVQGTEDEASPADGQPTDPADGGQPVKAPDAGEIEWAGGLIQKAPRSS